MHIHRQASKTPTQSFAIWFRPTLAHHGSLFMAATLAFFTGATSATSNVVFAKASTLAVRQSSSHSEIATNKITRHESGCFFELEHTIVAPFLVIHHFKHLHCGFRSAATQEHFASDRPDHFSYRTHIYTSKKNYFMHILHNFTP